MDFVPPPPLQPPPPVPATVQPPPPTPELAPVVFGAEQSEPPATLLFLPRETLARAALGGVLAGIAPMVFIYGFLFFILPALLAIPVVGFAGFLCGDAVVHGRPKSVDRTNKRIAYGSIVTIFIAFTVGVPTAGTFGIETLVGFARAGLTGVVLCCGLRWWRITAKKPATAIG